jgi:hypothetical protein
MRRQATLLEAFQAASGLMQQGLGIYSRETKYRLDSDLFLDQEDFDETGSRIVSKQQEYRNDPKGYKDYALMELAAWENRALARGNGSQYYLDQVKRMKVAGTADVNARAFQAREQHEHDLNLAEYTRERYNIINNNTPDEIIKKGEDWSSLKTKDGTISETQKAEDEQLYKTAALKGYLAVPENPTRPPAVFNAAADSLANDPRFENTPNRDQYIDAGKESYLQAWQQKNFRDAEAWYNQYTALVARGDPASLQQAKNIAIEQRPYVMAALKKDNPNYGDEHKSRMASWYREFSGDEPKAVSLNDSIEEAAARFFAQVVWNENVDNAGAGLNSSYNPLSYGNTLSELYMSLEETYGDKFSPEVLRLKLDNKIVDILRDNSDTREGKIILDQIRQLTDADDLEEFKKLTGLTDENISRSLMNRILDAYSRYNRNKGASPEQAKEARDLLNYELAQAKNVYSAEIMKPLLDRKEDSKSSLTRNILSGDLAKALAFINSHPELVKQGRDGSVSLESHYDDTVKTAMAQAESILKAVPGISTATLREGATVIGVDEAGNRYRLTGNGAYIQLQQEINKEWKPIAQRKYTNIDVNQWVELDASGEVVTRFGTNAFESLREPKEFLGVNGAVGEREKTHQEEAEEMIDRVQPPPGSNPPRGTARQREEERRRREGR